MVEAQLQNVYLRETLKTVSVTFLVMVEAQLQNVYLRETLKTVSVTFLKKTQWQPPKNIFRAASHNLKSKCCAYRTNTEHHKLVTRCIFIHLPGQYIVITRRMSSWSNYGFQYRSTLSYLESARTNIEEKRSL